MFDQPELLPIDQIRTDGDTQQRIEMKTEIISDYAELMKLGQVNFPPIVVFHDGTDYWLADGFYRCAAAQKAGLETIEAKVKKGDKRDAIFFSVGANAKHGVHRTRADKRKATETLLRDPEWRQWSDSEIAQHCGVSQPFVGTVRNELDPTYNSYKSEERVPRKGADGRTINTAKIGRSRKRSSKPVKIGSSELEVRNPVVMANEGSPCDDADTSSCSNIADQDNDARQADPQSSPVDEDVASSATLQQLIELWEQATPEEQNEFRIHIDRGAA